MLKDSHGATQSREILHIYKILRKRGRPKQTWRRSVHNEALGEVKSWGEVKQLARNRIRWRRFVDALCP